MCVRVYVCVCVCMCRGSGCRFPGWQEGLCPTIPAGTQVRGYLKASGGWTPHTPALRAWMGVSMDTCGQWQEEHSNKKPLHGPPSQKRPAHGVAEGAVVTMAPTMAYKSGYPLFPGSQGQGDPITMILDSSPTLVSKKFEAKFNLILEK